MIWYVHRNSDKTIASAHQEMQPEYAEEPLDDKSGELKAWFAAAFSTPVLTVTQKLAENGLTPSDIKAALLL